MDALCRLYMPSHNQTIVSIIIKSMTIGGDTSKVQQLRGEKYSNCGLKIANEVGLGSLCLISSANPNFFVSYLISSRFFCKYLVW